MWVTLPETEYEYEASEAMPYMLERGYPNLVEVPDEQWEVYKAILQAKEELEDHWRTLLKEKQNV